MFLLGQPKRVAYKMVHHVAVAHAVVSADLSGGVHQSEAGAVVQFRVQIAQVKRVAVEPLERLGASGKEGPAGREAVKRFA